MNQKAIAGIDLGTTFSALAVLNPIGKPEVIPTLNGDRLTASVVYFPENDTGRVQVGMEAKKMAKTEPHRIVQFVKRKMGTPAHRYSIDGRDWSAVEISSLILKKLKSECVQNGDIHDAVITVPAHFDEIQRRSTMDAGVLAGLNVLGIINEPTAAALFYASQEKVDGKILVYDLGGGTFDVTILEIRGQDVTILTSKGDGLLGGTDFDREIVRLYSDEHQRRFGVPLVHAAALEHHNDEISENHLAQLFKYLELAEMDKRSLSVKPSVTRPISSEHGDVRITITKEQFEAAISAYIAKTEMLVENALEDLKLSASQIDQVILVGGSTRIPAFVKSLQKIFGKAPSRAVNVDEAVALGAAISAGLKIKEQKPGVLPVAVRQELDKTRLTDVCNHYFGTIALSRDSETDKVFEKNCIILRKNTKLPCSDKDTFHTIKDNQEVVNFRVTQSSEDESDPEYVRQIGRFELPLPPGSPKGSPVEVSYSYDTNQILRCNFTTKDGATHEATLAFREGGMLTQSALQRKAASLNEFQID